MYVKPHDTFFEHLHKTKHTPRTLCIINICISMLRQHFKGHKSTTVRRFVILHGGEAPECFLKEHLQCTQNQTYPLNLHHFPHKNQYAKAASQKFSIVGTLERYQYAKLTAQ